MNHDDDTDCEIVKVFQNHLDWRYVETAKKMNTLTRDEKIARGYNVDWKCRRHDDSNCTKYECV